MKIPRIHITETVNRELRVGARVRATKDLTCHIIKGVEGTLVNMPDDGTYRIKFDNLFRFWVLDEDVEVIG